MSSQQQDSFIEEEDLPTRAIETYQYLVPTYIAELSVQGCLHEWTNRIELSALEEYDRAQLLREVARFFAMAFVASQDEKLETSKALEGSVSQAIEAVSDFLSPSIITQLNTTGGLLFSSEYPQVLVPRDPMQGIVVSEATNRIVGISDWEDVAVQPFGMGLDCLYWLTGYVQSIWGWQPYGCRGRLLDAFWEEFWQAAGIEETLPGRRGNFREVAEIAAKVGLLARCDLDADDFVKFTLREMLTE
ncbi:hypothetical protein S40288_00313 [Stachybotrys chartarum IBT 40288]|nr:hypothetical protein S40288_00313 [Stachybotrys chartarum IBT 40288]